MLSNVVGHVDSWAPRLRGWLINSDDPDDPVEIVVLVDNQVVARVRADSPRPDVLVVGHPTEWCGFDVPVVEVVKDNLLHSVSLVNARSGVELFNSGPVVQFGIDGKVLPARSRGLASVLSISGEVDRVLDCLDSSSRVALLSTFRPEGASPTLAAKLVDALHAEGFVVIGIDTSTEEQESDIGCDITLHRINAGLDFASWQAGIELLGDKGVVVSQLLFVNDSCYGPFTSLQPLFCRAESLPASVVALTDGWFGGHHLQSNFLLFKDEVLKSKALFDFFEFYEFPLLKAEIVRKGEIGLSRFLRERGFDVGALFPYEVVVQDFIEKCERMFASSDYLERYGRSFLLWFEGAFLDVRSGVAHNTTHAMWDSLLDLGMPFVKRDLLTKNPMRCPNILDVGAKIRACFGDQDFSVINDDLKVHGECATFLY